MKIAFLAPGSLFAQEFRGTLSGSVADQKGAPIQKAKVAATETRTGAATGGDGAAAGLVSLQKSYLTRPPSPPARGGVWRVTSVIAPRCHDLG